MLCLGTAQMGMDYGIANKTGQPSYEEISQMIQYADQHSIVYYDTARLYGQSEALLGAIFVDLGIQDRVKCISKLKPDMSFTSLKTIKQQIIDSLNRLGLTGMWGLITHRMSQAREAVKTDIIHQLKALHLIRNFGVSVYDPEDALWALSQEPIDLVQVPFNILDRRLIDNGFFDLAKNSGKQIFLRSIFLQGLLFLSKKDLAKKNMTWAIPHYWEIKEKLINQNVEMDYLALKMVQSYRPECAIIIGVENMAQLKRNIEIYESDEYPLNMSDNWWKELPEIPQRLVDPSKWNDALA